MSELRKATQMAKARGSRSDMVPKLMFRENGSAKGEGAVIFKENNVSLWREGGAAS